jgi:alpha-L-arabinofuranosidase
LPTWPPPARPPSKDKSGKIHISLCNLHHDTPCEVSADLKGISASKVTARILTDAKFTAHNTFDAPTALKPRDFPDAKLDNSALTIALPARSVVVLELA